MHQGSCLCGRVRLTIREIVGDYVFCHCKSCRKASGSSTSASSPKPSRYIRASSNDAKVSIRVVHPTSSGGGASPFAAALLFNYVGNYIYDGDVPLAEKRAASLALDYAQLKELLGESELRDFRHFVMPVRH